MFGYDVRIASGHTSAEDPRLRWVEYDAAVKTEGGYAVAVALESWQRHLAAHVSCAEKHVVAACALPLFMWQFCDVVIETAGELQCDTTACIALPSLIAAAAKVFGGAAHDR